ncbi:MAG: RbsD/FucU domain-containing protein [Pseudomonadota bacterium]
MLKGLSPLLSADLLWVLESMGHGDDLALVDRNFPAASVAAETVSGRLVRLESSDAGAVTDAILSVLPLDSFVDTPLVAMQPVDRPENPTAVQREVHQRAQRDEGRAFPLHQLERQAFYDAAKTAFAVVQCLEARPYACFLMKKGVIFE